MKSRILYEDKDLIVCRKPAGIATQTARVGQRDMVSEIATYLADKEKNPCVKDKRPIEKQPYVGLVHRLDQPVEGILVFARSKAAAAALSRQMTEEQMAKDYYAVICGQDIPEDGELVDYLLKDGRTNLSKVVSREMKGAKEARLRFRILQRRQVESAEVSCQIALARIRLQTGRHHQIRVQMANAGLSLLGDCKYADAQAVRLSEQLGMKDIALCAGRLAFMHPATGKKMIFSVMPEGKSFQEFRQEIEADRNKDSRRLAVSDEIMPCHCAQR